MTRALQQVAEKYVELGGETGHVHAELSERDVSLVIDVVVESVLLCKRAYLLPEVKSVELAEKRLLADLASQLFAQVDVIRIGMHRHRFEQLVHGPHFGRRCGGRLLFENGGEAPLVVPFGMTFVAAGRLSLVLLPPNGLMAGEEATATVG